MILGSVIGTSLEIVISNIFDSIDGDSFPFATGARIPIYCYGDSITANSGVTYDENNRGIPTMLEFYSNGRIKFLPQNNYAHGGDNSYDFKEYVTGGTPHNDPTDRRALYVPTNGLCYVDLSANDFGSDAQTYEEFVYNMTTGLQVLLDAGNFIILKNVKPRSTLDAADITQLLQMRAWVTQKCASNPMMIEMDGSLAIKSESDWSIATGYSLDGLHLNAAGATAITEAAWFDENLKNFIGTNTFPTGANDFVSSPFSGTGGTSDTSGGGSWTGTLYDDFELFTKNVSGTAQAAWTGTAITGGYEISGTVTNSSDEGHEYCYLTYPIDYCNTGDLLTLQAQLQCTEATNAYWCGMQLVCNPASADRTPYTFSATTTEADPTSGKVRMNNATASSVTEIYLSKTDSGAADVGSIITTWGDAGASYIYSIKIYKDSSNYHSFYIIGDVIDNGTWITVPVEYISTTGTVSDTNSVKVFPSAVVEAVGGYGASALIATDFIKEHIVAGLGETRQVKVMGGWTQIEARFNVGLTRFTGDDSSVTARITKLQVDRDVVSLAITGTPTADCEAGTPYTGFTPTVAGGTQPYTFSIAAGTLPTGLSLNSSTGAITGTPTVEGMYEDIVLRVTDAFGLTDDLLAFDMEIQAASGVSFQRQLVQLDIASGETAPASPATLSPAFDMTKSFPVSYGAKLAVTTTSYSMRDFYTQAVMATSSLNTSRSTATVGTQICEIYFAGVQLPSSMVDSVQIITGQLTTTQGAGADVEFSIPTAVTKSRSVTFVQPYANIKGSSTNMQNNDVAVDIKSDGTKLLVRRSSLIASATVDFSVAVIQFKAGVINNKQDGMITIGTSQATNTATITSVTTSNTILFPRGVLQGGVANSAAYYACAYPYLTNSTTVTATRDATGTTGSTTLDVYFTALELVSGHVSVQHKEIVMTGASSATVAITSSADATSFLLLNGSSCSATASSEERITAKIAKDSSTQLSATRIISTNNCTVAVQDIQVL